MTRLEWICFEATLFALNAGWLGIQLEVLQHLYVRGAALFHNYAGKRWKQNEIFGANQFTVNEWSTIFKGENRESDDVHDFLSELSFWSSNTKVMSCPNLTGGQMAADAGATCQVIISSTERAAINVLEKLFQSPAGILGSKKDWFSKSTIFSLKTSPLSSCTLEAAKIFMM